MANGYYGDRAVTLPNAFPSPGQALQQYLSSQQRDMERDQELQYRRQREQQADEWRKINLIQDLTDIDKYQTGSDVANAIGNQQASQILQKYTDAAKTMSAAELLSNVQKEMSGLVSGLQGVKSELELSESQLKQLKSQHPDLDVAGLQRVHRADIVNRRVKGDAGFVSPMEVQPSTIDLSNPDFLSKFTLNTDDIDEYISKAKGAEEPTNIYMGSAENYRKFTGKVPFWKTPNFRPDQLKGDFLTSKEKPSLRIKGTTLPAETLPSSGGKPFNIVDEDVYRKFTGDERFNRQLIKSTRDIYPEYDNFSEQEKEYAKRNVLYKKIETLDKNDFHLSDIKTPSASLLRFYSGDGGSGSGSGEAQIRDIYKEVNDKVSSGIDLPFGLGKAVELNKLSATAQRLILDYVNKLIGSGATQGDVVLSKGKEGTINIVDPSTGQVIAPIDFGDINVPGQPSVKERRKVIEKVNKDKKNDPLGLLD